MDDATLQELGWDDAWASELEQLDEDNLVAGRIAAQHRGEFVLWTAAGELRAELPGRIRYDAGVSGVLPAVGDWVAARVRALEGRATIHTVLPRRSTISRKEVLTGSLPQVLAANVDIAFLLTGLDADFSIRRLERYLVLAWESGAAPVVVLTKTDLCPDAAEKLLEVERVAIGVPVHPVSNVTGEGLDAVREHLRPATSSVLLGSSGVGKSTLINRIADVRGRPGRNGPAHDDAPSADPSSGRRARDRHAGPPRAAAVGRRQQRRLRRHRGARGGLQVLRLRARARARLRCSRSRRRRHARARPPAQLAQAPARARVDRRACRPAAPGRTEAPLEAAHSLDAEGEVVSGRR